MVKVDKIPGEKTVWHYNGKYIKKTYYPDNTIGWAIYNKYENGRVSDFAFECQYLKQLVELIGLFNEIVNTPVVEELIPDDFKTG